MADLKFEITKKLGSLSKTAKGWSKELNIVKWGDGEGDGKYDIRSWSEDYTKMSKGITLTAEELIALRELLNKLEL